MSCVLHITGDFNSEDLQKKVKLKPYQILEKGEFGPRGRKYQPFDSTTCSYHVSDKGFNNFQGQVEDAIAFLNENYEELRKAHEFTLEEYQLDFGVQSSFTNSGLLSQSDLLPAKLLKLAGNLEIDILISQYWIEEEEQVEKEH